MTPAEFFDDFTSPTLDTDLWIPTYLPQWSSREATRPRYRLEDSQLVLTIDPDQKPWSPEFNGPVRVSNLQTGVWSGPLGSDRGQHRFRPELRVREEQIAAHTHLSHYGSVEFRCRCFLGPTNVAALWLIGYEDEPQRSAEICLFELKGTNVGAQSSVIGYGLHPFGDSRLRDEFFEENFPINVADWQVWKVDWKPGVTRFFLNGKEFRTIEQAPDYPMQLMLNLYDLAEPGVNRVRPEFRVDWIRAT